MKQTTASVISVDRPISTVVPDVTVLPEGAERPIRDCCSPGVLRRAEQTRTLLPVSDGEPGEVFGIPQLLEELFEEACPA